MKKFIFLFLIGVFLISCKKEVVDATNPKTFQESINDMASSLTTLEQVKFNEALYILKTFGVEGETEAEKIKALGKTLNGMSVSQILNLADQVAQKQGLDWASTAPPSLGEIDIFSENEATQYDPNDIKAKSLSLTTFETMKDSVVGAKAIQIVPRLVDDSGEPIEFSGAALEVVMEVYSGGNKIFTSKNLMLDSDFKGFTLRYTSLPAQKIPDGLIDITVKVKTTGKDFKMSKIGIPVNSRALFIPVTSSQKNDSLNTDKEIVTNNIEGTSNTLSEQPKAVVYKFLNHLSVQNLRGAYEIAENPTWGSYESFSNSNSGFGGVKNISVKNVSSGSTSNNSATVNATYDITDKEGNTMTLRVTFGLKNINGNWKIISYKIN